MREIKFRVWDKEDENFMSENTEHGEFFNGGGRAYLTNILNRLHPTLTPQQFTGLKDNDEKDAFEGDLVEINYSVGDFAWEFMTPEEVKRNVEMLRQKYLCTVEWDEISAAFILIHGDENTTHTRFPAIYIKGGKVVGNIFERKE